MEPSSDTTASMQEPLLSNKDRSVDESIKRDGQAISAGQPLLSPPGVQQIGTTNGVAVQHGSIADLAEEILPTTKTVLGQCLFSQCCRPRRRKQRDLIQQQQQQQNYGQGPKMLPVPSAVDFSSPDGQALAQMAGGAWVTQVLEGLWPQLRSNIEANAIIMIPDIIENSKPDWMEGAELERFTLGVQPPIVKGIKIDPKEEHHLDYVRMIIDVVWASQSDIQFTVKPLPAGITNFAPSLLKNVVNYVTSLTAGVQSLAINAQLLVTLGPLSSELPLVRAMQVSLMHSPQVDFNITLTKGEVQILNLIKPWLSSTVAAAFAPFVLPEHISIPLDAAMPDVEKPEGVLFVTAVGASGVPKMDYFYYSDLYIDVWVRGRIKRRTPVIKKRTPDYDWAPGTADFALLVHTSKYQTLNFELWDQDDELLNRKDDLIGGASLKLTDLQPGKEHDLQLQVCNSATKSEGEGSADIDPAYAGGESRVDVSNTKLHVKVRYMPAAWANLAVDEVGCPGTLNMKISKVTVPDLEMLPLRARPFIVGQESSCFPPLSQPLKPIKGADPVTGEDRSTRRDIPFMFNAVWDVLGDEAHVKSCVFVLEMVSGAGSKSENVVARVEIPFTEIMSRSIAAVPGGAAGGHFVPHTDNGIEFDMQLVWSPLLDGSEAVHSSGDAAGAPSAHSKHLKMLTNDMLEEAEKQEQNNSLEPAQAPATDLAPEGTA